MKVLDAHLATGSSNEVSLFYISFLPRNMAARLRVIAHNCVTATLLYQLHHVNAIFHINSVDRNVYCSPKAVEMCKLPNVAFILSTLLFDRSAIRFFLLSAASLYLCLKTWPLRNNTIQENYQPMAETISIRDLMAVN